MKNYIFTILLLLLSSLLPAQQVLEDDDIAQNWTLTDINGQSHTLYNILNQNKTVVLFFFDASVSPCWTYHQTQALQDLEAEYGAGTSKDSTRVFYIETNFSTTINNLQGNLDVGQPSWMVTGNYVLNNPAPIINLEPANSQIFTDYRLADYPLVVTICPERTIKISGLRTKAQHVELFGDCQRQCNCALDLAAVKYYGPYYSCSDHMFHPKLMVQNLGTDTIYQFLVKYDYHGPSYAPTVPVYVMADSVIDMKLAPFDTALIKLNTYYLKDAGYMKVQALLIPGNIDSVRASNNNVYYGSSFPLVIPEVDTNIVFKLNTDQYGEEILWNLRRSNGDIIASGGPYQNLIDTGTVEHIIPLHLEKGDCYKITIFDTFGDGICCDNGHGSYQVIDSDGTVMIQGGAAFLEAKLQFRADDPNYTPTSLIHDIEKTVEVYPIPANTELIIELNELPKSFDAEMIDINGRTIKTWISDKSKQFIDISSLQSGIYLLKIQLNGQVYTKKVLVLPH